MKKTAFIFPGQGAQYVGMAKEFHDAFDVSRAVFDSAANVLDFDVRRVCFEENDDINKTEFTQAALLTAEISIFEYIKSLGIVPDICAGLSLGEYSALVACGAMTFEDAVKVVRRRGILMEQAVPAGKGAMAAIIGADSELVNGICEETPGVVTVANYNCPGQLVISGETAAVEDASKRLCDAGARQAVRLNVSGPFHSPLLKPAGDALYETLERVEIKKPSLPYVNNTYAEFVTSEECIGDVLAKQIYSPVKWQQSMEKMLEDGVGLFVEIGPGKTLSNFLKRIDRKAKCINIERPENLDALGALIEMTKEEVA